MLGTQAEFIAHLVMAAREREVDAVVVSDVYDRAGIHLRTDPTAAGTLWSSPTRSAMSPSATKLEMSWIARAAANGRRSWDSVHFYDAGGGRIAAVPRPPEPDWSTFGKLAPVKSRRCHGLGLRWQG